MGMEECYRFPQLRLGPVWDVLAVWLGIFVEAGCGPGFRFITQRRGDMVPEGKEFVVRYQGFQKRVEEMAARELPRVLGPS